MGGRKKAPPKPYLKILENTCSPEDWRAGCETAVEQFKQRGPQARAWLSKYLIPNPSKSEEAVESDFEKLLSGFSLQDLGEIEV